MFWIGLVIGIVLGAVLCLPIGIAELRRQTRRAREAEGRARDSQRLAEIGAMTGGLAHEIKNPLSTIGLNAQLLAEGINDLPIDDYERGRLVRRIDSLRREADRLRDTLTDFLRFAGNVRLDKKPTDLNTVVEELADFYMPQAMHRGAQLRTDLAPGPMMTMLDAGMFKQAILNLMINATQAMEDAAGASEPEGATAARPKELILRTESGSGGANKRTDAAMWRLHVIDTGSGIPAEHLPRIFTPYFTTKSGGSGLGLPTTKRLIEEHGGTIKVFSEPGKGSDFVIEVPRGDAARIGA